MVGKQHSLLLSYLSQNEWVVSDNDLLQQTTLIRADVRPTNRIIYVHLAKRWRNKDFAPEFSALHNSGSLVYQSMKYTVVIIITLTTGALRNHRTQSYYNSHTSLPSNLWSINIYWPHVYRAGQSEARVWWRVKAFYSRSCAPADMTVPDIVLYIIFVFRHKTSIPGCLMGTSSVSFSFLKLRISTGNVTEKERVHLKHGGEEGAVAGDNTWQQVVTEKEEQRGVVAAAALDLKFGMYEYYNVPWWGFNKSDGLSVSPTATTLPSPPSQTLHTSLPYSLTPRHETTLTVQQSEHMWCTVHSWKKIPQ